MSLWLDKNEMIELTNKVKYSAQRRALRAMMIDHITRADGRPLVSRALFSSNTNQSKQTANTELNLSAI